MPQHTKKTRVTLNKNPLLQCVNKRKINSTYHNTITFHGVSSVSTFNGCYFYNALNTLSNTRDINQLMENKIGVNNRVKNEP